MQAFEENIMGVNSTEQITKDSSFAVDSFVAKDPKNATADIKNSPDNPGYSVTASENPKTYFGKIRQDSLQKAENQSAYRQGAIMVLGESPLPDGSKNPTVTASYGNTIS